MSKVRNIGIWLALAINLFLLAEYFIDNSNARNIVFIFWIQTILLGLENVLMMLFANTGHPININNQPRLTSIYTNMGMAFFFMFHYGIFILAFGGLAVFSQKIPGKLFQVQWVFPTVILMCIGAVLELPGKILAVRKRNTELFGLMFIPYLRLMPFVVIIFGGEKLLEAWLFPLFLMAKLVVDMVYFRFFNFNQAPQNQITG